MRKKSLFPRLCQSVHICIFSRLNSDGQPTRQPNRYTDMLRMQSKSAVLNRKKYMQFILPGHRQLLRYILMALYSIHREFPAEIIKKKPLIGMLIRLSCRSIMKLKRLLSCIYQTFMIEIRGWKRRFFSVFIRHFKQKKHLINLLPPRCFPSC